MKLNPLNNWQVIEEKDYLKYGIIETEFMQCEGAYLKNNQGQNITITLFNYGTAENDAFETISKNFDKIEEENYLVDGNPNSPSYEDTSIISCILRDKLDVKGYDCLAIVTKILLPEGNYSYVFQLYAKSNGNLYSVQFKFANFDESNIEKSFAEDETLSEIMQAIY
jgi:hypothetical protein